MPTASAVQKVKTKTVPLWKVPHGVCNKGKNDGNNPFACTQNVHKTVVLPTAKNNVNGKQRIKRKSAVQKRRSSTPPFLLMLFYKPFPMQVLEKLTFSTFL